MKLLPLPIWCGLGVVAAISAIRADGQTLSDSFGFSTSGAFINGVPQGPTSALVTDNDLTDGYADGIDLKDAPASLRPSGPAGSTAFQWGVGAQHSDNPHPSALWFEPLLVNDATPGVPFDFGYLYYRNGSILHESGAIWVDLELTLSFAPGSGIDTATVTFGHDLINTLNTSDPIASADIVALRSPIAPLGFTDVQGNRYFLELTFRVDQDTLDGSLSSEDEFRVFEGHLGRAELIGHFTAEAIPEPSSALLSAMTALALFRRNRKNQ